MLGHSAQYCVEIQNGVWRPERLPCELPILDQDLIARSRPNPGLVGNLLLIQGSRRIPRSGGE